LSKTEAGFQAMNAALLTRLNDEGAAGPLQNEV